MRTSLLRLLVAFAFGSLLSAQAPPPASVAVHGRVCEADGKAIAGACLRVVEGEMPATAELFADPSVRTGDDGLFRVNMTARNRLVIAAKGRLVVSYRPAGAAEDMGLGDVVLGDVVLDKGTTWFGRVRTVDGKPLAGVRVVPSDLLRGREFGGLPSLSCAAVAITDASGIYRLDGIPDTAMRLSFTAPGFLCSEVATASRSTPISVDLQPAAACRGKLPVHAPGASVRAQLANGAAISGTVNAEGSFEIWVPPKATYRVRARSPVAGAPDAILISEILEGEAKDVVLRDLSVDAKRTIVLQVVADADGKPLPAFTVVPFWNYQHRMHPGHMYGQGLSNGIRGVDGAVRLSPPDAWGSGQGVLRIVGDGCGELFFDVDRPDDLATAKPIVVRMPVARTVRGLVTDSAGKALADVEVWPVPAEQNSSLGYGYKPENAVRTDREGHFAIRGLGPRRYAIQAFAKGRPVPAAIDVDLEKADAESLAVQLAAGNARKVAWQGQPDGVGWFCAVKDKLDAPQQGTARWNPGEQSLQTTPIDPATPYAFATPDDDAVLLVGRRSHGRTAYPILFGCDPKSGSIDFTKLRTGWLRGHCEVPAGTRDQIVVEALPDDASASWQQAPSTTLQPDGSFEFELAPRGYRLQVRGLLAFSPCWTDDDPIAVNEGAAVTHDIAPDIGWVHIHMPVDPTYGVVPTSMLILRHPSGPIGRDQTYVQGGGSEFLCPTSPGPCSISVQRRQQALEAAETWANGVVAELEAEVRSGEVTEAAVGESNGSGVEATGKK